MTKKEAVQEWKETCLPYILEHEKTTGWVDKDMRAQSWNNFTDQLCKERRITLHQYNTWGHP